jgi:RNA polymerase sigma-70 factor (ECF subfamily)
LVSLQASNSALPANRLLASWGQDSREMQLVLGGSEFIDHHHAVAVALAGDVEDGLALLDGIEGLDAYHLLHAARADLFRRLDQRDEAAAAYRRALELTPNEAESRFLERRLAEVS